MSDFTRKAAFYKTDIVQFELHIRLINYNTGTSGTTTFIVYICGLHVSTYTQVIFRPSCTGESIKSYARWDPIALTSLKHINYMKCLCLSIKVKIRIHKQLPTSYNDCNVSLKNWPTSTGHLSAPTIFINHRHHSDWCLNLRNTL